MNTPNKITISRLVIAALMVIIMVLPWWPKQMHQELGNTGFSTIDLCACVLFIVGAITDAIDGHLARSRSLVTNFGIFFDPLADKFLVNSAFIILAVTKPSFLPVIIVAFMIGRDIAVDGIRLLAAKDGRVIAANIFGKIKTVCQMIVIPLIMLSGFPFNYILKDQTNILLIILASLTLATSLISGGIYIYNGRSLLKGEK